MIISDNPKHKGFPNKDMNKNDRLSYLSGGRVTVGKLTRIVNRDFVSFYLPRIRSMNFCFKKRKYKRFYKTPDQAYLVGCLLSAQFKNDYNTSLERNGRRSAQNR